ncbi:hypothetical protein NIES4075_39750 [Tolypothrix sp. NIES-4075]|nr:hypothetical protein NIES4075_39750 [Tolypothrix sp. NIES-4075]
MSGKPLTLLYETLRERVRQSLMGVTNMTALAHYEFNIHANEFLGNKEEANSACFLVEATFLIW